METTPTTSPRDFVKLNEADNVAIAVRPAPAGAPAPDGTTAAEPIPQAHKIALTDIPPGAPVCRYGAVIGRATRPITRGSWINEHMLAVPDAPDLDDLPYGTDVVTDLPASPLRTFRGYRSTDGQYAGTRNLLAIHTTVQCVAGVVNVAVDRIRRELLPRFPGVDGVVPLNHAYGCGIGLGTPEAEIPLRTLRNLIRNPNFGGEVMVVALGCEVVRPADLLEPSENTPDNVIVLQEQPGFQAMVDAIVAMAEAKLARLNTRVREELPLSQLMVGVQCGGSDAFSGVSANPALGVASDMLVEAGATVLFSEVTEVRDGVHLLAARCVDAPTRDKLVAQMAWYDAYLAGGGLDRSDNPGPGNKAGGLSNIVEKALGSIAKSGRAPLVEVLAPGERPSRHGLIYADTPAGDFVCGTCQLASGIGLQVFTTGRGTPYGLAAAPVVKVSTRHELKALWDDLIDVDAGSVASGEATVEEFGLVLLRTIVDVASGARPAAERFGLHNDLVLFNPAPIT